MSNAGEHLRQGRLFDTRVEAEKAAFAFGLVFEPDYEFESDDSSFDGSADSDGFSDAGASVSRGNYLKETSASSSVSREVDLSRSE